MTFGQKRHVGTTASTQAETTVDTTATPKWSKYVAVGLSISNGNSYENNDNTTTFDMASYPSLEFGFSRENISLGVVLGRGNFRGLGDRNYVSGYEQIDNPAYISGGPEPQFIDKPIYSYDNLSNYY
jgi:hypothetical protein